MALLQALLFMAAFAVAGMMAIAVVRRDERQAVDGEIGSEVADLVSLHASRGTPALLSTIAARQRDPSIWEFRLQDGSSRRLAGDLPDSGPKGWSTRRLIEGDLPGEAPETVRAYRTSLSGGLDLTVGEDVGQRERSDNAVLSAVLGVAAGALALSLIVAAALAQRALARVDAMSLAMQRYGSGKLSARALVRSGRPNDLDHLAAALNRMLDRNSRLMAGLRQVSADIAHDLRRPLARHNERISGLLEGPASLAAYRDGLVAARDEVDAVLATFQALLHIAELEAGAPGLPLEPVDLGEVAKRVVRAFEPMAEEGGRRLHLDLPHPRTGRVAATPALLSQMLVNLVENALIHTPLGSAIVVGVGPEGRTLTVTDDGPGVPPEARGRIFQRFTRLDPSRTTPGSGLGLALASAIAQAFQGRLYAEDAAPGLRVVADFRDAPAPPQPDAEVIAR